MNKKGIIKTTLKSVIALLAFSAVLEINSSNFGNYLIFVGAWMILTALYEVYKYSTKYNIGDEGLEIFSPLKKKVISYNTVNDVFLTNGILQTRFHLSSVYVIQGNKATAIRDLTNGETVLNQIEDHIGRKRTDLSKDHDGRIR